MPDKLNIVHLTGNMVDDEPRVIEKDGERIGVAFRIAYDTGNYRQPSGFIKVTVWGALASNYVNARKGARVEINGGRLTFDTWEKDGVKRSTVTLAVDSPAETPAEAAGLVNEHGAMTEKAFEVIDGTR